MKRIYWLDLLRIISIFSMILLHVAASFWYVSPSNSYNWIIMNIYDSLVRFCVPVFLMISGALFLSQKEINIKKLYTKNILRLLISLIFWNFLYSIYVCFNTFEYFNLQFFINNLCNIHYHLPFLLQLIGLYILTPLLKKITDDKNIIKYILLISFIFAIIIPTIKSVVTAITLISGSSKYLNIFKIMSSVLLEINIPFVTEYFFYYLLGYYIFTNDIKHKKTIYILGLLGTLFTVISTFLINNLVSVPNEIFYNYYTLNVMFSSIAIFVFFKSKISKINISDKKRQLTTNIANCCFGIYLIHDFFIMFFKEIGFTSISFNPLFSIPITSFSIFLICYVIIFILSKIPIINKYLI